MPEPIDLDRLLRIMRMSEDEGREAVSDEDLAWADSTIEEFRKLMPRITPEEVVAYNALKVLPEEIVEAYGDWTLRDLAVLWPMIRTELYAKGYLNERGDGNDLIKAGRRGRTLGRLECASPPLAGPG